MIDATRSLSEALREPIVLSTGIGELILPEAVIVNGRQTVRGPTHDAPASIGSDNVVQEERGGLEAVDPWSGSDKEDLVSEVAQTFNKFGVSVSDWSPYKLED